MFGIDSTEFLLIAIVALVVIGPKDLPRVMRLVGGWVGRGRAMTRHLRSGFDTMMREAELEEMQRQWAKQNADIMAATAPAAVAPHSYDPTGTAPHDYDTAIAPHDHHPTVAPHDDDLPAHHADAVVGERAFDHPGALPASEVAMTGPRPAAAALAPAPMAVAAPAAFDPAPTAQP